MTPLPTMRQKKPNTWHQIFGTEQSDFFESN